MILQEIFLYFLIFMFGASVASFIFVFIERGDKKYFFSLKNKSICSNCLKRLNFFELIPIFSFLFLKGKCKTCKTKIPKKLFFGEFILGSWFLASFFYLNFTLETNFLNFFFILFFYFIFGSIFFLLTLEDFENMEVSSKFLYALLAISIFANIFNFSNLYNFLFVIFLTLPFWTISFLKKNWLGEADPYIFTSIGLFFGLQFLISDLLYSIWFGAAYGILYLIFINKKFERGIQIPFLPIIFFSTLFILKIGRAHV